MTVPVLAAVSGEPWEAALVSALERTPSGMTVVRRCVDVGDLLAAAAAGTARAVLLSAELRRLDRDTLARLAAAGVAVVGLVTPGDETAERRLRQLGLVHVLPADADPALIFASVALAVEGSPPLADAAGPSAGEPPSAASDAAKWGDPGAALPRLLPVAADADGVARDGAPGRLVAVWGPTGAPGRTTVAVTLASELAALGTLTLLADADVYGGAVAQCLGLLDESPGLAAAARSANGAGLDLAGLARLAPVVSPGLRVLTGISRADRWPELRPSSLEVVWSLARTLAAVTVVDCGFCLERDEEISYDTAAPRRNGATLATLELADVVIAVGSADPVGIQRLVRGVTALREVIAGTEIVVVVNRLRRGAVGAQPERQVLAALERYAAIRHPVLVPEDRAGLDAAVLQGLPLREVAGGSPARAPIAGLAARLRPGEPDTAGGRRPHQRRSRRSRASWGATRP